MTPSTQHSRLLGELRQHLQVTGYSPGSIDHQCKAACQFLIYLQTRHISVTAVQPCNVVMYMRSQLRAYCSRHRRMPTNRKGWRTWCTDGVAQLLRLVHRRWPPPRPARNPAEAFALTLCRDYHYWLADRRGLAASTTDGYLEESRRFLAWYHKHCCPDARFDLSLPQIDQYLRMRAIQMRRTTLKTVAMRLSSFLRFMHRSGYVPDDLSGRFIRPTLYEFESIPSVLRPAEITQILKTTRRDRSPRGRRDYAILCLLAMYGLRAGEIVRLTLDDINWRAETVVIRHSKVRGTTVFPLLPEVGEALLAYLRYGRPKTSSREVFIRMSAPLCGFSRGSSLHALIRRRIAAAGVHPRGKRGPHVFRHAHAVGLLRAAVPTKAISDLLGHRCGRSTAIYLKLDTEELRTVCLPVPVMEGVS